MNAQQRKYLTDQLSKNFHAKREALEAKRLKYPDINSYVQEAVLKGEAEFRLNPDIWEHVLEASKSDGSWSSKDRIESDRKTGKSMIKVPLETIMKLPEGYVYERDRVKRHNDRIEVELEELRALYKGLEMRVQLASNKVLDKLIAEIDDLGDLKLFDTNLKELLSPADQKKLT